MMRFGSVCSGIEAASVAWNPLGWEAEWLSEIEPFPSAVLAHHYPNVPNLGDMTTIKDRIFSGEIIAPDILVGGTPCQAFSVAGMRKSLSDNRGKLTLEYVRLANAIDTKRAANGLDKSIVVWENVPGVLNTRDNAFGCFLGALVGESRELQPPGCKWTNAGCVFGRERAIAWRVLDAKYFGLAQRRRRVFVIASARDGFDPSKILFEQRSAERDYKATEQRTVYPTLQTSCNDYSRADGFVAIHDSGRLRRITPVEAERLQGFPDNYTRIPIGKKAAQDCPDGPRYKALGNSMAVPCMHWIGERIQKYINGELK